MKSFGLENNIKRVLFRAYPCSIVKSEKGLLFMFLETYMLVNIGIVDTVVFVPPLPSRGLKLWVNFLWLIRRRNLP